MSPPRSMLPHTLGLSPLPLVLCPEKRAARFPRFPSGLPGLRQPGQTRLLPHDGRTQNSLALLRNSSSHGLGRTLGARARCKHSELPSPSSSPAVLLPALVSLTPLQLQLNATVLKQAAFYRTANRAERTPLLPSSVHIPVSPQLCVCLCARGPSKAPSSPLLSANTGEILALQSP